MTERNPNKPPSIRLLRNGVAAFFCVLTSVGVSSAELGPAESASFGHERPASLAEESDSAVVTFTGLRVYDDGSSTLVVSLTRKTPVEFSQEGTEVTFLLAGAKVRWRNNKNPLLAKYFKSNVIEAKLDDSKDGATLVVQLRENVRPQHNMGDAGGGALLRIDVPAPASK
jgi:hypothetical protein